MRPARIRDYQMKKTLLYLLAFSLLTACGGNKSDTGDDETGNKQTATKRVIKASELISNDDAAALLGQSTKEGEITKRPFIDESRYVSKDYNFSIALCQEALHDKNSDFEKNLLKKGWTSYIKEMEKAYSKNYYQQNIVEMGGIDGKSYLQDGGAMGLWLLHIFYGEYYISITVGNTSLSRVDSEAETLWKQAKLKEAGNRAVGRLKAILENHK